MKRVNIKSENVPLASDQVKRMKNTEMSLKGVKSSTEKRRSALDKREEELKLLIEKRKDKLVEVQERLERLEEATRTSNEQIYQKECLLNQIKTIRYNSLYLLDPLTNPYN